MQTMEERAADMKIERLEERMDERFQRLEGDISELRAEQKEGVKEFRKEFQDSQRELGVDIRAMQSNMLFGFFGLVGLFLIYTLFQFA